MSATLEESQTMHFSITGEFMTQQARTFWMEDEFAKAFDLLGCLIGATREQHEEIIFGRKKLTGVNDLDLEADDWTPPKDYPSFHDALSLGKDWRELKRRREEEAWKYAKENFMWSRGKGARRQYHAFLEKLVGEEMAEHIATQTMHNYAEDQKEYHDAQDRQRREERREATPRVDLLEMAAHAARQRMEIMGLDPKGIATTDAILNRGMNLKPVLCPDMSSPSGWLLPDGKYYGCGSMEHIGLATRLLEEELGNTANAMNCEEVAENRGWVKITRGLGGLYVLCKKTPNKKQMTKLWDYAQFHKEDYEKMIDVWKD